MAQFNPTVGNRRNVSIMVEDMTLPAKVSDPVWGGVVLEMLRQTATPGNKEFFDAARGANKAVDTISLAHQLEVMLYLRRNDPVTQMEALRGLEGNDKRASWHEGNSTLTPSVAEPLKGGLLRVPPNSFESGKLGDASTISTTFDICGRPSELTAPLPAPAGLVVSPTVPPTATTIDFDWTADTGYLVEYEDRLVVRGYVIRYQIDGATSWTEVVAEVVNTGDGTLTHQLTGLTATSLYNIEVIPVWQFGHRGTAATVQISTV